MKKKILIGALVLGVLVVSFFGFRMFSSKGYEGVGFGFEAPIKVKVEVGSDKIKKISILESSESSFTKEVFKKVITMVITEQSVDIDAISGATVTSQGLLNAIKDAVDKSSLRLEKNVAAVATKKAANTGNPNDRVTEVLIIGAGGAGLTATVAAYEAGVKVLLIEKMGVIGGNTNFSTGGINAANTKLQKKLGIEDSEDLFFEDTLKGGKGLNNKDLLRVLVDNSKHIIDWLQDHGVDIAEVGFSGGQSVKRFHRPTGGKKVGPAIIEPLSEILQKNKIDVRLNTKAIELIKKDDKIIGAKVEDEKGSYNIYASAVIMTTGGFAANSKMVVEYKPELKGFGSTNASGITGEGIKMMHDVGGKLVDMKEIQVHPTVVHNKTSMITESVRGEGAILINREGKRFIDELQTRDVVSAAELKQTGKSVFLFFDQEVRDRLKVIDGYVRAGHTMEAETLEELAKKIAIEPEELIKTIKNYNEIAKNQKDSVFGREKGIKELSTAPFYAIEVSPAVHHTMGGVHINSLTEVIEENGKPIPGLYAAGEVTGGIHGANRIGGNAVVDITVFGKIAGETAAMYAKTIR